MSESKIIIQHLQSKIFIERWLAKSDKYNDKILEDCFDKFFTQFVVFNRLYNDVKSLLFVRKEIENIIANPLYSTQFKKGIKI